MLQRSYHQTITNITLVKNTHILYHMNTCSILHLGTFSSFSMKDIMNIYMKVPVHMKGDNFVAWKSVEPCNCNDVSKNTFLAFGTILENKTALKKMHLSYLSFGFTCSMSYSTVQVKSAGKFIQFVSCTLDTSFIQQILFIFTFWLIIW